MGEQHNPNWLSQEVLKETLRIQKQTQDLVLKVIYRDNTVWWKIGELLIGQKRTPEEMVEILTKGRELVRMDAANDEWYDADKKKSA